MPASSARRSLLVGLVALTLAATSAGARQQTDPDAINRTTILSPTPAQRAVGPEVIPSTPTHRWTPAR